MNNDDSPQEAARRPVTGVCSECRGAGNVTDWDPIDEVSYPRRCRSCDGVPSVRAEFLSVPKALLMQFLHAQERMLNDWAEGDKGRQNDLWRGLHTAAETFRIGAGL